MQEVFDLSALDGVLGEIKNPINPVQIGEENLYLFIHPFALHNLYWENVSWGIWNMTFYEGTIAEVKRCLEKAIDYDVEMGYNSPKRYPE